MRTVRDRLKTARHRGRRARVGLQRAFGSLTASRRALPDFLVIGAQRCGSSSLFRTLETHPAIGGALLKEPHFFDLNFERGLRWYRGHFPTREARRRVARATGTVAPLGEATPYYLFHPHVPAKVAKSLPDARLIVVVRDPVERAFSHYHQQVRRRGQKLTFEEALRIEAERLGAESQRMLEDPGYQSSIHQNYSYLARGRYAEQLERWFEVLPQERFLVLRSEDFFSDPAEQLEKALAFLGLPPWRPEAFPHLGKLGAARMREDTRHRLEEYFRPHNLRLAALLGRDFGWDAGEDVSQAGGERGPAGPRSDQ